jgi:flavodoxin
MKAIVIYSSKTGNTKKVAEAIQGALPTGTPIQSVADIGDVLEYDLVFMGYWVDRGTADEAAREIMAKIGGKPVALFATLGAYPDSDHARQSLERGASCLGPDCVIVDTFICQGAVAQDLQERMKQFPADHPHAVTPERLKRWADASTHPDDEDCANAARFAQESFAKGKKLVEPDAKEPLVF